MQTQSARYIVTGETNMQSNHILMPVEVFDTFAAKYNIMGTIEFKDFDYDLDNARNFFAQTKKQTFLSNDRYLVIHQDTDVYIDEMTVGLNLRNFFLIADEFDIPFYTLIIWTNHFGLRREIDILCKTRHAKDRPMIVESFCARAHVADSYTETSLDVDSITIQGLCMMAGSQRSHRYALYNALKHIDQSRLALSIQRKTR